MIETMAREGDLPHVENLGIPSERWPHVMEMMVGGFTKNTFLFAHASAIIVAHSILDALVEDLCKLSAEIDPEAWYTEIENEKISDGPVKLSDLKNKPDKFSYDKQRVSRLNIYIESIGKLSILKRCELLFKRCPPMQIIDSDGRTFSYDESKLVNFDKMRHKIIHEDWINQRVSGMTKNIEDLLPTDQFADELKQMKNHLDLARDTSRLLMDAFRAKYGLGPKT
ncbi:hypothetical protein HYR69_06255 [Candidatus Sumerlaeota bacterium]|nr:hypothetical protein [Candidatus Sumerlaeota bacterium]